MFHYPFSLVTLSSLFTWEELDTSESVKESPKRESRAPVLSTNKGAGLVTSDQSQAQNDKDEARLPFLPSNKSSLVAAD